MEIHRPQIKIRSIRFDPDACTKVGPPQPRANFLTNDCRVIIGPYPSDYTTTHPGKLLDLYDYGVTHLVNLAKKYPDFPPELNEDSFTIIRVPLTGGKPPSQKAGLELVNRLIDIYLNEPDSIIYIHCMGGHGRAGTIAALFIGTLKHLKADLAIKWVNDARNTREDTSRNFIPTPETQLQVNFLIKMLGVNEWADKTKLDRSDQRWLERVKAERRQRKTDE